jgi:L-alanine-DL-glutamate epimerase-like enolase superfamily enzyme
MQITHAEITPVELKIQKPIRFARQPEIDSVTAIFVRLETKFGRNAWGCGIAHPDLTGEEPADAIRTCQECANLVPDLHPTNIEYSLAQLSPLVQNSPAAACAFDLVFHDLLGLAANMPLYRLLGGYRNRIQTSITVPISPVGETVDRARLYTKHGFERLKVKGGLNPGEDVQRVKAIRRALPQVSIWLDADGGYTIQEAIDISRALEGIIEMFEQPTDPDNLEGLHQVTEVSPIPVVADQSVTGPASALRIGSHRCTDGLSVKISTCGGLRFARQVDAIARAAGIATMVGCLIEPAILISAGLNFALSTPNVQYCDLDGHLDLVNDPCLSGFHLENGCLVATEVPGLGCTINFN